MTRSLGAVRRGQAVVEFAFIAGMLMFLTVAIVDFGMAIWEHNTVAYLAREGARYGVIPTHCVNGAFGIKDYVFSRAVLPNFNSTACAGRIPSCVAVSRGSSGSAGPPVVVTVNYPYSAASGMIGSLTRGAPINLSASASMYVERGVAPACTS